MSLSMGFEMTETIIRERPQTLQAALTSDINDQNATKNFRLRRRTENPMDVDVIGKPDKSRVARLERNLEDVVAQLGTLISAVHNKPERPAWKSPDRARQPDQRLGGQTRSEQWQGKTCPIQRGPTYTHRPLR